MTKKKENLFRKALSFSIATGLLDSYCTPGQPLNKSGQLLYTWTAIGLLDSYSWSATRQVLDSWTVPGFSFFVTFGMYGSICFHFAKSFLNSSSFDLDMIKNVLNIMKNIGLLKIISCWKRAARIWTTPYCPCVEPLYCLSVGPTTVDGIS